MHPVAIAPGHMMIDYIQAIIVIFGILMLIVFSWRLVFPVHGSAITGSTMEILRMLAEREALWVSAYRGGVYEYQQHQDGRRRAVVVEKGESVRNDAWLAAGEQVPS